MNKLDLHGIRHQDVRVLVEDFVYMNQHEFPLEIVCGNSNRMIEIVQEALYRHGVEIHMYRYGTIVVRGWN